MSLGNISYKQAYLLNEAGFHNPRDLSLEKPEVVQREMARVANQKNSQAQDEIPELSEVIAWQETIKNTQPSEILPNYCEFCGKVIPASLQVCFKCFISSITHEVIWPIVKPDAEKLYKIRRWRILGLAIPLVIVLSLRAII